MGATGGHSQIEIDGREGHPVDRMIRLARERPLVVAVAVTGWILSLSLFNAYYVAAMEPAGGAVWYLAFSLGWLLAGLVTGRFWSLLLAFLPVLVMATLGTTPLYGSSDMPQWVYAMFPAVIVLAPATFLGVIAHKCIADIRGA